MQLHCLRLCHLARSVRSQLVLGVLLGEYYITILMRDPWVPPASGHWHRLASRRPRSWKCLSSRWETRGMPAKQPIPSDRGCEVGRGIQHHLDHTFDVTIDRSQGTGVHAQSARDARTHRFDIELLALDLAGLDDVFGECGEARLRYVQLIMVAPKAPPRETCAACASPAGCAP